MEMAETLIFTRVLEIISNRAAGMVDAKDSRRQMSKVISADMQGWADRVDIAEGSSGLRQGSNEGWIFWVLGIFRTESPDTASSDGLWFRVRQPAPSCSSLPTFDRRKLND